MAISLDKIRKAERFLRVVAVNPRNQKRHVSYTEFCDHFGLGPPHENAIMIALLLAVVSDCKANGWPDFAALVIHEPGSGQREGPGKGWYEAHHYMDGDLPKWRQHRDDCWARAASVVLP